VGRESTCAHYGVWVIFSTTCNYKTCPEKRIWEKHSSLCSFYPTVGGEETSLITLTPGRNDGPSKNRRSELACVRQATEVGGCPHDQRADEELRGKREVRAR